jgi:hypothetical protein
MRTGKPIRIVPQRHLDELFYATCTDSVTTAGTGFVQVADAAAEN